MDRNPEYQFIPTDTDALAALVTAVYEKLTGTAVRAGSPERLFIQWVSSVLVHERVLMNYAGNQNIPSRAEGENLDALAELTGCRPRPEAESAVCTMRFHISQVLPTAVLIPAGTRVTDAGGGLVWATFADAYVPVGETFVDVPVRCRTAGTVGNGYVPGQISTLVDLYEYYSACENVTTSEGGSDRASDGEYYELLRASMDSYSCAGARGGYIYWAKQVSTEIADVAVNSPAPGVVKIYVLMEGGTPAGEEMKGKVLAACSADNVRPLTDYVLVEDAEIVPYEIAFTYYTPSDASISAADLSAAVIQAVANYISWQCGKLGRDINPSYLIGELMKTGVKRVELTAPVFIKLRDGSDKTVPQLAKLQGTPVVINGGYENE